MGLVFYFFLFFFLPKASPVLCFQFPAGEQTHAMGVGGVRVGGWRGGKEGRKKGESINRTEAGNDELKGAAINFSF